MTPKNLGQLRLRTSVPISTTASPRPGFLSLNRLWATAGYPLGMLPEIDIWRVANLMLRRYGSNAEVESARRADELWDDGDPAGVAVWRRIIDAIGQLTNMTPPGPVH